MINKVDHLIVAVKDIEEAENNFSKLFGAAPVWTGEHPELGTVNSIFNFSNIYFELLASKGEGAGADFVNDRISNQGEGLAGLVLGADRLDLIRKKILDKGYPIGEISEGYARDNDGNIRKWENLFLPTGLSRGIFSFLIKHTEGKLNMPNNLKNSSVKKLDHVVINTNDPDGFIEVYGNVFDIRLALDQTVEKWGGRMLFFRVNKTTIEVIAKKDEEEVKDSLWGMAWDVENLEATHKRLDEEGFELTEVKEGRKPNTLVATVKSKTHNIPTLLIQHLAV